MASNFKNTNTDILIKWLNNKSFYSKSVLGNEEELIRAGENKALKLFHEASHRVPAYKDFLKKNKINPLSIKTSKDFKKLPAITKENYIEKYNFQQRAWDGDLSKIHMISTSSGTTGNPNFWPRNLENEIEGAYAHELIFRDILKIKNKKTLLINGFALGNWIAGTFTSSCVSLNIWKGYPIVLMSPGYSSEAIVEILEKVASEFEIVVLSGHTPLLKEVVELATKRGINWSKINLKLLGTGQAVTEGWRNYILKTIYARDYYHTMINLYGSADAALMGFETSQSIYIRKILADDLERNKQIFKDQRLPSLCSYDPRLTYFEVIEDELHITKDFCCPLIKYNIHDEGGIKSYGEMMGILGESETRKALDLGINPGYQLPFVYLFGREKFMVKIYGANVYSENVQNALSHENLQPLITGRYILQMDYNQDHNPEMVCRVELNPEIEATAELVDKVRQIFVEEVRKVNNEYNFVFEKMGSKVEPRIILHKHGDEEHFPKGKVKKTA